MPLKLTRLNYQFFLIKKNLLPIFKQMAYPYQQLGTIDVPNVGRSSAYIVSQLSLPPTNFFGLYTSEDELGDENNVNAIPENEQVTSVYLEIPFLNNVRDQDGDGVIDSLDADPFSITSDSDGG